MMDYLIRAESQAVFRTYAQDWGWIDEEDRPTQGTLIDELGPVVVTPAVIGEDMTITTPAVMDDWHHVNVRLVDADPVEARNKVAENTTRSVIRGVNVIEKGEEPTRIQLLYPEDIMTPIRIWADGMHHVAESLPDKEGKPAAKKSKK